MLITLSVLSILLLLSATMVQTMDEARQRADAIGALVQANVLASDTGKALKKIQSNKTLYTAFLNEPLPLQTERTSFSALVSCKPKIDKVNLNWLVFDNNETMAPFSESVKRMLYAVGEHYGLENTEMLTTMISQYFARLATKHTKKGMDRSHFFDILMDYVLKSGDEHVSKVPWQRYFVFDPIERKPLKIAGDFMSTDAVALLFDIEPSVVREEKQTGLYPTLPRLLTALGADAESMREIVQSGTDVPIRCRIDFVYRDKPYRFEFESYEGKVRHFVFIQ